MFEKLKDRRTQIFIVFSIFFAVLFIRLAVLTIVQGEYYAEKAVNNRVKKIAMPAKRGQIYDRNGVLLAGNEPGYNVYLYGSTMDSQQLNEVAVDIIDILDAYDETYITFPIQYENGEFYYTYDKRIDQWLVDNDLEDFTDAEDCFNEIRRREQISVELDDYEAQKFLILKGVDVPISVKLMKFTNEIDKSNFLKMYGLDPELPAEEAFLEIRNRKEFAIPEEYSDEDAIKILTVKHALKEKGYLVYDPILIANDISVETSIYIKEIGMDLPGITVEATPIRYYPHGATASHMLGYMGKISSEAEIQKYIEEYGYDANQIIGKTGLEGTYELELNGEDGYKYIEVDAYGKLVNEIEDDLYDLTSKEAIAGEDIYLTIDVDLQKYVEERLNYTLEQIQIGGVYESPFGDYNYSESFPNAQSGAVVVLDVNTGEVLAMTSQPDYDPNLFATGISQSDWDALQPDNPNNPLAARPLYNTATLTAAQVGSIYKMVTGYAAVEQGLDPYQKIYADGFIQIGANRFGCWYYNDYRMKHGYTDLIKALEVSCNYYMFNIATGYDYYKGRPLPFEMNTDILIEYSKLFGLDEKTGLEITETNRGVPDPDKKKASLEYSLKIKLRQVIDKYFPSEMLDEEGEMDALIDEIVSWSGENPSRGTIINRLLEMGAYDDYYLVGELADIIKYDYFNLMKWYEGDTFNLSIGQGSHEYTPVQMARYVMTIANGGYLYDLTLVKSVGGEPVVKNDDVTNEHMNLNGGLEAVKEGMYAVTHGSQGTARRVYKEFPIPVAAKTGTAQREGKIPPADEVVYFYEHLNEIDPNLKIEDVEMKTQEILVERNEELAQLELKKESTEDPEEIKKIDNKISSLITSGYLNKSSAMRQAIKDLSQIELTDTEINEFRDDYDAYAWFASFAPYENPEIAIVAFVPQGGHGGYTAPLVRDIYAYYFGLDMTMDEESDGTGVNTDEILE